MSTLAAAVTSRGTSAPGRINYKAILVGSIAAFVIASVYYGVVFSDLWLQVRRLTPSPVGDVNPSPVQPLVEFLVTLVIASAIGYLVARLGITDWKGGLRLAAVLWTALPGMLWLGAIMWENTPWQFAALHGGDWLVKCVLFTLLPSVWRR